MTHYALLCGSAPGDFRQKKLVDMHDFLEREEGGRYKPQNIIVFPNGVNELFLENVLNNALDAASEEESSELLLYLCTESVNDMSAELTDSCVSGVEVVRLGNDEIRKEVIAYYEELAEKLGVVFCVVYDVCAELVSEETLGYEKVGLR